jgi:hypothetical protein
MPHFPKPAVVGIEATGSMGWFVRLMEELGVTCRVGHPAAIRTVEPRRQKHDRRDAQFLLRANIGMIEARDRMGFSIETLPPLRIGRQDCRYDLDCNWSVQRHVACSIDFAHSARTEATFDLVRTKSSADGKRHGRREF